ncbi:hypothetical protein N7462_008569 [Penicillium macrosclerotiorum]|uniref:uncharacterized protein n=1 Tax=Penicillium macrosclerotiorum TaxID=303699 RepID=UPI0025468FB3|nr:uncharacterized protein N7462_008569 [Penicillium macrosclerotiorum]KAJ5675672.1 hypothetical protein N7462_008569 [Penicillium macrosclerotiorum]
MPTPDVNGRTATPDGKRPGLRPSASFHQNQKKMMKKQGVSSVDLTNCSDTCSPTSGSASSESTSSSGSDSDPDAQKDLACQNVSVVIPSPKKRSAPSPSSGALVSPKRIAYYSSASASDSSSSGESSLVVKPASDLFGGVRTIEPIPDTATIMNFPLPKIDHQGLRPSIYLDNEKLYKSYTKTEEIFNDLKAMETAYEDTIKVRELVDWDCRRLGLRLRALRRRASLQARRGEIVHRNRWSGNDNDLLEMTKSPMEGK